MTSTSDLLSAHALVADPFAPTPFLAAAFALPRASKRRRTTTADPPAASSLPTQEEAHASADAPAAAEPEVAPQHLAPELLAKMQALRKPLRDAGLSEEARTAKCEHGLHALFAITESAAMGAACEAVGFSELADEAMLCACVAASKPDVSGRAAAAFVAAVLQPRLTSLSEQASRSLFSALLALQPTHAKVLLDELIMPTLWHTGGALSAGQAEVLTRLLKELPEALLLRALHAFLDGHQGEPQAWSESQVALLQALLARKPPLDAPATAELLVQCDANVDALRKSLKFANLVSTIVRMHAAAVRPHLSSVRRVAERLDTFMRKSILQALQKLEDAAA